MKQPDSISIKFDDAIEMLENLEYFLHKQLPEDEEEKILKVANSLRARIQIHKELAIFYHKEEN
tara:strand:- start:1128 stop:1319 length:192 start_codon:yes stop_codon:yes gene_type:complete